MSLETSGPWAVALFIWLYPTWNLVPIRGWHVDLTALLQKRQLRLTILSFLSLTCVYVKADGSNKTTGNTLIQINISVLTPNHNSQHKFIECWGPSKTEQNILSVWRRIETGKCQGAPRRQGQTLVTQWRPPGISQWDSLKWPGCRKLYSQSLHVSTCAP